MNFKISALITIGVTVMLGLTSVIGSHSFAQTNGTASIDERLLTASDIGTEAVTASGDTIFVIVCPQGWSDPKDCEIFNTTPARR